jgi:hypothetical protein
MMECKASKQGPQTTNRETRGGYSIGLFCKGYPVSDNRRLVLINCKTWDIFADSDFSRCPDLLREIHPKAQASILTFIENNDIRSHG